MTKTVITKKQAVEQLLESVNDWEWERLTVYCIHAFREKLANLNVEGIESEYNLEFNGFDNDEDDSNYVKVIDTKASRLLLDKDVK